MIKLKGDYYVIRARKLLIEAGIRHTMQRKSQNAFRSIQVLFTVWKRECGKSALSQN